MVELPLTKGKVALIDDEDAPTVLKHKWTLLHNPHNGKSYACRGVTKGKQNKTIYLHRFLMNAPKGVQVDHINGDGLDNRRANLRLCDNSQNHCNMKPIRGASVPFKGVRRSRSGERFYAQVVLRGKRYRLGSFATAEEAARAYDAKARELHGEFARTNF